MRLSTLNKLDGVNHVDLPSLSLEEEAILDQEIAADLIVVDNTVQATSQLADVHSGLTDVAAINTAAIAEPEEAKIVNQQLLDVFAEMATAGDDGELPVDQFASEGFASDVKESLAKFWKTIRELISKAYDNIKALIKKLYLSISATARHNQELKQQWAKFNEDLEQYKKDNEEFASRYQKIVAQRQEFEFHGDVSKLRVHTANNHYVFGEVAAQLRQAVIDASKFLKIVFGGVLEIGQVIDLSIKEYLRGATSESDEDRLAKALAGIYDQLAKDVKGISYDYGATFGDVGYTTHGSKTLLPGGIVLGISRRDGSALWSDAKKDPNKLDELVQFKINVRRNQPGSDGNSAKGAAIGADGIAMINRAVDEWTGAKGAANIVLRIDQFERMWKAMSVNVDKLVVIDNKENPSWASSSYARRLIKAGRMFSELSTTVIPKMVSYIDDVVDESVKLAQQSTAFQAKVAAEIKELEPSRPVKPKEPPEPGKKNR